MRVLLVLSLVVAVAGCASTRHALGLYKRTADKGVTLGSGTTDQGVAPPGSAGSETSPASGRKGNAKAPKLNLPTGLGGDKEHHAYTSDTPQ